VLNFLYSLAFLKPGTPPWETALTIAPHARLLIDSGGYTNFTQQLRGREPLLTRDQYVERHRALGGAAWKVIALDDPGNAKVTKENLDYFAKINLDVMPVFSPGMSFAEVPRLAEQGKGWLCVGGCVGARPQYAHHRYQKIAKLTKGSVKVHALGYTRLPDMFRVPIASCDSTSYQSGGRFGTACKFDKRRGTMLSEKLGKWSPPMLAHAAKCKVTTDAMRENTKGQMSVVSTMTVNAFLNIHNFCESRSAGPMFFFALEENYLRVIAAVRAAKTGETFDYPLACKIRQDLLDLGTGKPAERAALAELLKA
jgi:hypothetical protein